MIKQIKVLLCRHVFEYDLIVKTNKDFHTKLTCRKCGLVRYKFE